MERIKLLQQIYYKLAKLSDDREVARLSENSTSDIDAEMEMLRNKLKILMNEVCPVIGEE